MKILGIDPGLERIGFAYIAGKQLLDYGIITTSKLLSTEERLQQIYEDLNELLDTERPDIAAVEKLFFVQNVTNGIAVAQARGVILLALTQQGIPIIEILPKEAKISICGQGNAAKDQVQRAVQQYFRLPTLPQPDDAADAIALALCGLEMHHQRT